MEPFKELAIHVVIICSLIIAIIAAISGYTTGSLMYLQVLTSAVLISVLAACLYVLERILEVLEK